MPCSRGCCPTPRDHWLSVSFSAEATPTRRKMAVDIVNRDRRWDKDMPAYKTLRKQGYQPPQIDGCADRAAKAQSRKDIEDAVS